jgi:hypothetical protein
MREGSSQNGSRKPGFRSRNVAIKASVVAFAALISFVVPAPVRAQALPRMTVTAFWLSADTMQPHVGSRFHLIVTLHVAQRVPQIESISDTLQLPVLAALEIRGDERGLSAGPQGSVYREAVTVEAQAPGTIEIDPARFEAIDARDGRAKEWSTNVLVLHVVGSPGRALARAALAAGRIAVVVVVGFAALAFVVLLLAGRRDTPVVAQGPAPVPPAEPSERERLIEALGLLRAEPTRSGAMRARAVLHRMVGAEHGETLHDVMQRAQQTHPVLLGVLPDIERAAFTYDNDIHHAVAAAIVALERTVR